MTKILDEVRENYLAFSTNVSKSLVTNIDSFRGNEKLIDSYARIAAINAIKIDLVEPNFAPGAAHFFYEAHNDALLSHVNASFGSWRPALQSLRSFMENTMASIYYLDHPIEFEKWRNGTFMISPKDLRTYTAEHPKLSKLATELDFKAMLDKEYSTLSKAVHGSNALFRMTTSDGKTNIASASTADLGKWSTRERTTIDLSVTALVGVLSDYLEGAKMQNLRTALRHAIQSSSRVALKKHAGVLIPGS